MPEQWFVVRSKSGKEKTAAVSIAAKDYPVFLPVTLVERSHAGKRERISKPLFPRYLFVRFDPDKRPFGEINYCVGVASKGLMVNLDEKPVAVKDSIIADIRARETAMRAKAGEVRTGWAPGSTFKLQVGRYADFDAVYLGEEKGEVWVTIKLFGREFPIAVPFNAVPPCENMIDRMTA